MLLLVDPELIHPLLRGRGLRGRGLLARIDGVREIALEDDPCRARREVRDPETRPPVEHHRQERLRFPFARLVGDERREATEHRPAREHAARAVGPRHGEPGGRRDVPDDGIRALEHVRVAHHPLELAERLGHKLRRRAGEGGDLRDDVELPTQTKPRDAQLPSDEPHRVEHVAPRRHVLRADELVDGLLHHRDERHVERKRQEREHGEEAADHERDDRPDRALHRRRAAALRVHIRVHEHRVGRVPLEQAAHVPAERGARFDQRLRRARRARRAQRTTDHLAEDEQRPVAVRVPILARDGQEAEEDADHDRDARRHEPLRLTEPPERGLVRDLPDARAVLRPARLIRTFRVVLRRDVHQLLVHERVLRGLGPGLDVLRVERRVHLVERRGHARGVELAAERVHARRGRAQRLDRRGARAARGRLRNEQRERALVAALRVHVRLVVPVPLLADLHQHVAQERRRVRAAERAATVDLDARVHPHARAHAPRAHRGRVSFRVPLHVGVVRREVEPHESCAAERDGLGVGIEIDRDGAGAHPRDQNSLFSTVFFAGLLFFQLPHRKKEARTPPSKKVFFKKKLSSPMDAYLRDTGVEMQTYSRNGTRVQTRENEALVRALLLAYIAAWDTKRCDGKGTR